MDPGESAVRGKMHLFHRYDFCKSINAVPGIMRQVFHNFVGLAHLTQAVRSNYRSPGQELAKVQGSLLGFIRTALKWCVNDEGVIHRKLVELLTRIESNYFTEVTSPFLNSDKIYTRLKKFSSMQPEILDAFSAIIKKSETSIFSGALVMKHLMPSIERPYFIHKSHEKQCVSLKKLIKDSNTPANREYLSPLIDSSLDYISWFSICNTWDTEKASNIKKCMASSLHCDLLRIWVWQSSCSPNFTHDFLEAYVECIQQHLTWLLEEQHCFLTEQSIHQASIMQDLLRLVLSLFSTPEHESNRQILSRTKMHVCPALTKLGAAIHSFTLKGVDGKNMSSFEISDWFTRICQALFLPLDSDCLLSNETMSLYAYYYRRYLLQMPKHEDIIEIKTSKDQPKFGEDLLFVTRAAFREWPEHLIQREILVKERILVVGLVRSLGCIICSSLNNDLPIKMHPGLPDLLANFEHVKVQSTRKICLQILKNLNPQTPVPNLLAFLSSVSENLKELLTSDSNLVQDWYDQLQTIREHLLVFRSYLQNTKDDGITEINSQDLTSCITSAAYDVEYIIDTFASRAFHVVWGSFLISDLINWCGFIDKSIKRSTNVVVRTSNLMSDAICKSSRTPVPQVDLVIGFEVAMKEMMGRLTSFNKQLDVISVVGMAGIGKTTLAKKVYEDSAVVKHFDVRAWCCVSQEYTKKDLLLEVLGPDVNRQGSTEDLEVKLHQMLYGRRYLIVLDDIWEIDAYDYLQRFCPNDGKGSRIVFTSRIISMGDHSYRLQLSLLSDDESWTLLKQKISFDEECHMGLSEIGKEISRKCGGLPLAVVVVAGILAKSKKGECTWKEVAERLSVYNADDCEDQRMKALDLSYELLPDHIKPLFLYIGAFPEDRSIPAKKLQQLWIGEGLIKKTTKSSLEAEAYGYLKDLIDRSLVMVGERNSNDLVKTCLVHDLIRDMCIAKAKAENFMEHTSLRKKQLAQFLIYHRRASVSLIRNKRDSTPSSLIADKIHPRARITYDDLLELSIPTRLRSLLLFGNRVGDFSDIVGDQSNLKTHKMLRVLDASEVKIGGDWLTIAFPMNLRYLSLNFSGSSRIPLSLFSLWNLETMVLLGGDKQMTVPGEVWKMNKLRHLHFDLFMFSESREDSGSKLENLQTLSAPIFFGEDAELIVRFPNLLELTCYFSIENGRDWPRLESLYHLESLYVWWRPNQVPCYEPQFSRFPSNLKELSLIYFGLKWKDISNLQVLLPNLEILKLLRRSVSDELWDMEDGVFPKLKFLQLTGLNIEVWIASEDNFSCLLNLVLEECDYLEEIPLGFCEINTLEKIEMWRCSHSSSESAKQIQQQVEEYGNDLSVYISKPLPPQD